MSFPPYPGRTTSKGFRERAEEARVIAVTFADPVTRNQMLTIAAGYDRMAEHIERQEADAKIPAE